MSLRQAVSNYLNKFLGKFDYAFIKLSKGAPLEKNFGYYQKGTYGYENLLLIDVLAPWSQDKEFLTLYHAIKNNTLVDIFRCYELYQLVYEVSRIPGNIIEVGVWRGGTGAILGAAAKKWKPEAQVFLCDTFEGVVKASLSDDHYSGGEHADTSVQLVEQLTTKLSLHNITILKGIFPDETANAIDIGDIALCHIDVDVYQSAADVVAWAQPRMKQGACLVFDDYGYSTCSGVTKLVDELRATDNWFYVYNLNKHAILIKR